MLDILNEINEVIYNVHTKKSFFKLRRPDKVGT